MKKHNQSDELTSIGTVVGAHGINGELVVYPLTDSPEYYLTLKKMLICNGDDVLPAEVQKIRIHKEKWLIKFDCIPDRTAAESFKKSEIKITDDELKPLSDDEYFLHDIIGCEVLDESNRSYGIVTSIMETGANDVYVVKSEKKEYLIPGSGDVIKSVDLEKKTIVIELLDGLIDS